MSIVNNFLKPNSKSLVKIKENEEFLHQTKDFIKLVELLEKISTYKIKVNDSNKKALKQAYAALSRI